MRADDFAFLARLLVRRSGLLLHPEKQAHLACRLEPVVRLFGLKDMDGLLQQLRLGDETLAIAVTEAMTVNETSFFRDAELFARIERDVLPPLLAARAGQKRLRIWSAAAAGGQEVYSLAMMLAQMGLARRGWSIDLIATDLSVQAIARAERGLYTAHDLARGLTQAQRTEWFAADGEQWRISETLRRMVRFRAFNLLDSFGWLDDLDIIFCRNVLMYFDRASKVSVLERMADTLAPDGMLVLGSSENATLAPAFIEVPDGGGIYGVRPQPRARLAS